MYQRQAQALKDENQVNVTLLGDSTLGNSVEHLKAMLPSYIIHDYTRAGFTTEDCLHGSHQDKMAASEKKSLSSHGRFRPLVEGMQDIKKSQYIVVSVGRNDFREFFIKASQREKSERAAYINHHFPLMLQQVRRHYLAIIEQVSQLNNNARIILMTDHYPSFFQDDHKIYEFIKEMRPNHNPMTVIQGIIKEVYTEIFKSHLVKNMVVADLTSSFNLYERQNYIGQIEPSGIGGGKIAKMLSHLIEGDQAVAGQSYRFFPEFFTAENQSNFIEASPLKDWKPAHPFDYREGYTLEEEKIFHSYSSSHLDLDDLPGVVGPRSRYDKLLANLKIAVDKHGPSSQLYQTGLEVWKKSKSLLSTIDESNAKQWEMSIVLVINVLNDPTNPKAVRLLEENANHRAIGKGDGWKQLKGALMILAGAAMIGLAYAGIPFVASTNLVEVYSVCSLFVMGGVTLFYQNRQKSLSKELSTLVKIGQSRKGSMSL